MPALPPETAVAFGGGTPSIGGLAVFVLCWSVKGGSGTTVVACSLALSLAAESADGALLVDLAGDVPSVLGVPDPGGPGVQGWLHASPDVGAGVLTSLESDCGGGLTLLPAGDADPTPPSSTRWNALGTWLAADTRSVVIDCGNSSPHRGLRGHADSSLLITRLCFLALRRASGVGDLATGVVVVAEPGRALSTSGVARVVGAPVVAEIPTDPSVARSVDAGLLLGRLPASLRRPLRGLTHVAA